MDSIPRLIEALVILSVFILGIALVIKGLDRYMLRLKNNWKLVCEGVIERTVTKTASYTIAGGFMGFSRNNFWMTITTIFFMDGNSARVRGLELPPPGTYIKLYKNGTGEFRIETPPTPPAYSSCL